MYNIKLKLKWDEMRNEELSTLVLILHKIITYIDFII